VPAGVVQGVRDLLRDPQLASRGHFVRLPHGVLGELYGERTGYRLSASPGGFERAGPRLGEHTGEVLREILGLGAGEIEELRAREVLI
jgi:formyl-CoA transferase